VKPLSLYYVQNSTKLPRNNGQIVLTGTALIFFRANGTNVYNPALTILIGRFIYDLQSLNPGDYCTVSPY